MIGYLLLQIKSRLQEKKLKKLKWAGFDSFLKGHTFKKILTSFK